MAQKECICIKDERKQQQEAVSRLRKAEDEHAGLPKRHELIRVSGLRRISLSAGGQQIVPSLCAPFPLLRACSSC